MYTLSCITSSHLSPIYKLPKIVIIGSDLLAASKATTGLKVFLGPKVLQRSNLTSDLKSVILQ